MKKVHSVATSKFNESRPEGLMKYDFVSGIEASLCNVLRSISTPPSPRLCPVFYISINPSS